MARKCPKCDSENTASARFCSNCATPLPGADVIHTQTLETPREELARGSTFANRYEIIDVLGRGGMGQVYRVGDAKVKEEIALKIIKTEIAADIKTIERFRNEMKLARKIRHKNVCAMFDLGEEQGIHFITMEYVPGEDLKDSIKRFGKLPIDKSIDIAKQICEGLSEAHRLGVVHRDLKPGNIMIDKEGNVRIMDFGIARTIESKGITGSGVMIGTPEYMSPEQVEGKDIDSRSDIYSLGVILYEMVTGRVPFEGDTPLSVAVQHKTEPPKDPKEINAQIPEGLSRLILTCMQKDKKMRYQSAEAVCTELVNIENGLLTSDRKIPKRKPITSREITVTLGMKKLIIPIIIVICAAALVLIIWSPWKQERLQPVSTEKPSLAVLYITNSTGDQELDYWSQSLSNLLIDAFSQSKYIYVQPKQRLLDIYKKFGLLDTDTYSSQNIEKLASYGVGKFILWGNFYKSGEDLRISLTLHDVKTGSDLGPAQVEGSSNEVFELVDELTSKVKELLPLSKEAIASDLYVKIGKATTNSPEAYKYFSEGTAHYFFGNSDQAIPLLERALGIDPDFVMAHRHLGTIYWNKRNNTKAEEHIHRAFELKDNVSERVSLLVETMYFYNVEKDYDHAFDRCRKLLELFPEDIFGNRLLGNFYNDLGDYENALGTWKQNRINYPESTLDCTNYSVALMNMGRYAEAAQDMRVYLTEFPENTSVRNILWQSYLHQEKYDLALQVLEERFLLNPARYRQGTYRSRGDVYLIKGELDRAEQEYRQIRNLYRLSLLQLLRGRFQEAKELLIKQIEVEENERYLALSHLQLAYLYLITGYPEHALQECEKASFFYPPSLIYKGRAFLDREMMEESENVLEELRRFWMENEEIRYSEIGYKALLGRLELKRGNYEKAVEHCRRAIGLRALFDITPNNHATYVEPLASAYFLMGDLDKAEAEYQNILSLSQLRLDNGDIYVKSFYMLGKIYEQQGETAKARENYEKFLDLWNDADPGITEVGDARMRLARLKE